MAYKRIVWLDHVVERPRTYTEIPNGDGSKTLVPAPGHVIQAGTPITAENLNRLEEALQHYAAAFDVLVTVTNSLEMEIKTMREQLDALAN